MAWYLVKHRNIFAFTFTTSPAVKQYYSASTKLNHRQLLEDVVLITANPTLMLNDHENPRLSILMSFVLDCGNFRSNLIVGASLVS
jgi:hypothetical protein